MLKSKQVYLTHLIMTTQLIEQILQLSIAEGLELIENIWNSIFVKTVVIINYPYKSI
ncbi:MAG: hypothetical protein SWX82_27215 [Cyanobacteriota bacterium]|nr:hypothetical protein [Cyanobacteriota bacterium]